MTTSAYTRVLIGLDFFPVCVTVDRAAGGHGLGIRPTDIRGLPEAAANETRIRVTAALIALGHGPDTLLADHGIGLDTHLTVTLDPIELPKYGGSYELAIAVAILGEIGALVPAAVAALQKIVLLGELALDGRLRPVRGLRALLNTCGGPVTFIVPEANALEIAQPGIARLAPDLAAVVAHLSGARPLAFEKPSRPVIDLPRGHDMEDLPPGIGRRALEIAAAGGHGLLFIGRPGSGKTLYARRLATILPSPTEEEAGSIATVHNVAGLPVHPYASASFRPFRAPHHTVSTVGLLGGGAVPRPGEVSLAHHGVLFLDELTEFQRATRDALEEALREGQVVAHARAGGGAVRVHLPAEPFLVGAMNPAPLDRVGRLLNRFDLIVHLPNEITAAPVGESSATVRARVTRAWELGMAPRDRTRFGAAFDVVGRVARTLANLDGESSIREHYITEARTLTQKNPS